MSAPTGRFGAAVTIACDGYCELDLAEGGAYFSARWFELVGLAAEAGSSTLATWLGRVHDEDLPALVHDLVALVTGRVPVLECEHRVRHADGGHRTLRVRARLIEPAPGRAPVIAGWHTDLTRVRGLAASLRELQPLHTLGRLAGGIVHDFNNLLTVIGSLSQLMVLKAEEQDSPCRADAEELVAVSRSAGLLTGQLLALCKPRRVERGSSDVNETVRRMERLLLRIIGDEVTVRWSLAATRAMVPAGAAQLLQVLVNLVANARDAMPDGGTLVVATADVQLLRGAALVRAGRLAPGAFVALSVADDGVGMDAAVRSRALDPLFTTKGAAGTGLGLATVHDIVRQCGGDVEIASEPGVGTTVTVYLPAVGEDAPPDAPSPGAVPARGGGETVLVVDDDPGVRRVIQRTIEKAGYTVLVAGDGVEALGILRRHPGRVKLVVSDVVMPVMDGPTLARQLRQHGDETPILWLSGYPADYLDRRFELPMGAPVFVKPIPSDELADLVHARVSGGRPTSG